MRSDQMLKTAAVIVSLIMPLTGCRDPAVQRLNQIKQVVCACKTLACADQALQAMSKTPARRLDKAQDVASEIFDCYSRLAKGDPDSNAAPTQDAPADGPSTNAPSTNPPSTNGSSTPAAALAPT